MFNFNPAEYDNWLQDVPEDEVVAYDWKGNEIYAGESVFECDGEYIVDDKDEIIEYFESIYGSSSLIDDFIF